MEECYQKEPELHFEELANHYIQAGETAKAAEFSRPAGDRAAALHAHNDAKNHFRNVIELLEPGQISERLETITKIADTSNRLGEHVESVKSYREAISLAENMKDNRKMAQLYLKLGYAYYVAADNSKALEKLKQGLTFLQGTPNTHEEAAISQNIPRLLLNSGEVEEGLQWCEKAIQLAKQLDDKEVLAHALISRSYGLRTTRRTKIESFQQPIHSYTSDPEVFRYVEGGPLNDQQTRVSIEKAIASQREDPRLDFRLAVALKEEEF